MQDVRAIELLDSIYQTLPFEFSQQDIQILISCYNPLICQNEEIVIRISCFLNHVFANCGNETINLFVSNGLDRAILNHFPSHGTNLFAYKVLWVSREMAISFVQNGMVQKLINELNNPDVEILEKYIWTISGLGLAGPVVDFHLLLPCIAPLLNLTMNHPAPQIRYAALDALTSLGSSNDLIGQICNGMDESFFCCSQFPSIFMIRFAAVIIGGFQSCNESVVKGSLMFVNQILESSNDSDEMITLGDAICSVIRSDVVDLLWNCNFTLFLLNKLKTFDGSFIAKTCLFRLICELFTSSRTVIMNEMANHQFIDVFSCYGSSYTETCGLEMIRALLRMKRELTSEMWEQLFFDHSIQCIFEDLNCSDDDEVSILANELLHDK